MAVPGQPLAAQDLMLVGRVFDKFDRSIAGVEVILNRTTVRATTDASGGFRVRINPADSTIGFRRIGYRPLLLSLQPMPDTRDTLDVELTPSEVQLPEIIVTAPPSKPLRYAGTTKYDDVFQRRRVGLGTLITREMIDRHLGRSTIELLQEVPGVHFFNGPPVQIQFARCREPGGITVFVDGVRQVGRSQARPEGNLGKNVKRANIREEGPEVEILANINRSDIEMIEVYRGASEIPGVFHWNGCAVVAVWMK